MAASVHRRPDHRLPLIAGDVVYNLRAGLDHLACALVSVSDRSHVMFPILIESVWDIPVQDAENQQGTKNRQRRETGHQAHFPGTRAAQSP
jgi:hypothetical protein